MIRQDIRNLCIIAHVDHGKTTLVDHLLKQGGLFAAHEKTEDRMMDSNALERERGITILAKNCSVNVKGVKLNIVDTPGHADFGGEVERIIGTVDGAVLLVDAAEGPLPQTRFVLEKALKMGHKIILCINKVDRPEVQVGDRIQDVVNQVFDLFVELGATDEQCDFPIVYAVAREGWCTTHFDDIQPLLKGEKKGSLEPLFDLVLNRFSGPKVDPNGIFTMQLSNLAWSNFVGQLSVGRVIAGKVRKGQEIFRLGIKPNGDKFSEKFQVTKLFTYHSNREVETEELSAGDIGIVAGNDNVFIGDTLGGSTESNLFSRIEVQEPTLRMIFSINSSPLSGKEGEAIQSRKLRERLERECRANVAVQMEEGDSTDQYFLLGRGELQFAILIETMRREGLEFMVGRPVVRMIKNDAGEKQEPVERAVLYLPEAYTGAVTEMFQNRKGVLSNYENMPANRVKLVFDIPSRGLLGIRSNYLTATRGEGLFSSELAGYEPFKGEMLHRKNGAIIADRTGKTTEYALSSLEERGVMFIGPGVEVYEGMVIGEHSREQDLNVDPTKEKKLTNVRAAGSDGLTQLAGIRQMPLERSIEWLDDDEWIEVTPKNIRLRKKVLQSNLRSVTRSKK
jgi:GTP-binding protein